MKDDMKKKDIKVISLSNPFSFKKTEAYYPNEIILSEILNDQIKDCFVNNTMVVLSDSKMKYKSIVITPDQYDSLIIKNNDIVTLRARPSGGGDDGKDIFGTILSIAVLALGAFFGPALGAFIMGSASATATAVGMGVINLFGSLAINALVPAQTPQYSNRAINTRESPTLSVTGSQNRLNHYGVVPRVFGTHKVFPVMGATPYTEIAGNEQFLRLLFDFGYGELELDELKIGNIALSEFEDVETEIRPGTPTDDPITLYSTIISQETFSIKVTNTGGPKIITSEQNTNSAVVDAAFNGLLMIDEEGKRTWQEVQIKYEYREVGSGTWLLHDTVDYLSNTVQAYYVTETISFSSTSQYEVRITRETEDATEDNIQDEFFLRSIKSVTDSSPMNVTGRCLVAMRIKATDQLNGMVDQFSAIVTSKLPKWNGSSWDAATTSRNPAWAFAEVLRGAANANPIADSFINGDDLLAWANACDALAQDDEPKWQFDAVIDFGSTVFEALRNIASAGRASFSIVDGQYTVIRDIAQSIPIQHFTPRNSWGFNSTKIFIDTIHAVKVRFINPDRDWQQDEVIVYADGYNEGNATEFQSLELWGCTSQNQAWRDGRYNIAVAQLRPEVYKLQCDIENLVCTRGDLVRVTHDVTGWGQKGARILVVTTDGGGNATHITIDEEVTMEADTNYNVRIRDDVGSSSLHDVVLDIGTVTQLEFSTPISPGSIPQVDDLIMFGQQDLESVELIVQMIEARSDLTATLTLIDYSPTIQTSDTGTIPAFDPKITSIPPVQRSLPDAPVINALYSDSENMFLDYDGTLKPQIVVDIAPAPDGTKVPRTAVNLRYRESNINAPYNSLTFPGDQTKFFIRGVEEGVLYDIGVRAESHFGEVSSWSSRNSYNVIGRTDPPATPSDFHINIISAEAHLTWTPNTESDLSYYQIRFTPLTTGATFKDSIDVANPVPKSINSLVLPARTGTYFIKAVDVIGKKSTTAAEITTIFDSVKDINLIEIVTEDPAFAGVKTNCLVNDEDQLILDTTTLWDDLTGLMDSWPGLMDGGWDATGGSVSPTGTYEFANLVDLGSIYTSRVTAIIDQQSIDYTNTFDDLEGNIDQLEGLWDDLNGTAPDVNVKTQVALTDDNPGGSPTWSSWQDFFVGEYKGRGLKFRAILTTEDGNQSPQVEGLSVEVDMPDRIDSDGDILSSVSGSAITLTPAFKSLKKVGITAQDLQQGDYFRITSKSTTGFTVTFYNSSSVAVARTFDWDAVGYGHLVT